MNRLEDAIRDYLADHLILLEPNLQLIQKEFRVPNPGGSGGRIDLLAKDKFGHFVIIEIKRSNQSARQALNEIHKYTALFRIRQGLDEKKVRLMVVSTEWHELLLPLAEYAAVTPYSVEGVRLLADSKGMVSSATPVDLRSALDNPGILNISPCQMIYLFKSSSARDSFSVEYRKIVPNSGVDDFVLFHCDYHGDNSSVIYPHALYFCFSSPLIGRDPSVAEEIKAKIEWDDELDDPDENFACAIEQVREISADDLEIGYPEKLANITLEWSVIVASREGRFCSPPSLLTDIEIIAMAKAIEGGSTYYLSKMLSPKFKAAWEVFREDIIKVVCGYPNWEKTIPCLFDEIATANPNAVVSASVYAPGDLFMALYSIAGLGDYSKCPQLQIVVEQPDSQSVTVFLGVLVWNGTKISNPFSEVLKSTFGDIFQWMAATHFGSTFKFEAAALSKHNLDVVIVEWQLSGDTEYGPCEVKKTKNGLLRLTPEKWNYESIKDFSNSHRTYLRDLKKEIDAHCI